MTQEELQKEIASIFDEQDSEDGSEGDWHVKVLKLINKHATRVIGEDDPTIFGGIINRGHDCYPAIVKGQNELRAEQRKRAGL